MTEGPTDDGGAAPLLDEALEAWVYARTGIIEEAGVIPDEE